MNPKLTIIADKAHTQNHRIKVDLSEMFETREGFERVLDELNGNVWGDFIYFLPRSFDFDEEKYARLIIPDRTHYDLIQFNNLNKNTKFSQLVNCTYVPDYMKSYCSKSLVDIAVSPKILCDVFYEILESKLFVPGIMHLIIARFIYDRATSMLMVPGDFVKSNGNEFSNVRLSEKDLEFMIHFNQCLNLRKYGKLIDENDVLKLKDDLSNAGFYRY